PWPIPVGLLGSMLNHHESTNTRSRGCARAPGASTTMAPESSMSASRRAPNGPIPARHVVVGPWCRRLELAIARRAGGNDDAVGEAARVTKSEDCEGRVERVAKRGVYLCSHRHPDERAGRR